MFFKMFLTVSVDAEILTHVRLASAGVHLLSSRRQDVAAFPLNQAVILAHATRIGLSNISSQYVTFSLSLILL